MDNNNNGKNFSIAALVCGIIGIVGLFLPWGGIITLVLAILGIVFGVKGRKESEAAGMPTGMATAGFVLGIIGVVLYAVGLVCALCVIGAGTAGMLSM